MNIFKIKKKDVELFYASDSQRFEAIGTIYNEKSRVKRALSFAKSRTLKTLRYYTSPGFSEYRIRMQSLLTDLNVSTIVEYELVKVKEYDSSGGEMTLPIEADPEVKPEDPMDNFEKIDLSTII